MRPRAKGLQSDSCLEGKEEVGEHKSINFTAATPGSQQGDQCDLVHRTPDKESGKLASNINTRFMIWAMLPFHKYFIPLFHSFAPCYELKCWTELVFSLSNPFEEQYKLKTLPHHSPKVLSHTA